MAKKTALGLELNVGLGNSLKNLKTLNFSFKTLEKEVSRFSHLKNKAIEFTVANATLGAFSTLGGLLKSASVDAFNYSRSMQDATRNMSAMIAAHSSLYSSTKKILSVNERWDLSMQRSAAVIAQFRSISKQTGQSVADLSAMFTSFYSTASSNMSMKQALNAFKEIAGAVSFTTMETNQLAQTLDSLGAGVASKGDLANFLRGAGLDADTLSRAKEVGNLAEVIADKMHAMAQYSAKNMDDYTKQLRLAKANWQEQSKIIGDIGVSLATSGLKFYNYLQSSQNVLVEMNSAKPLISTTDKLQATLKGVINLYAKTSGLGQAIIFLKNKYSEYFDKVSATPAKIIEQNKALELTKSKIGELVSATHYDKDLKELTKKLSLELRTPLEVAFDDTQAKIMQIAKLQEKVSKEAASIGKNADLSKSSALMEQLANSYNDRFAKEQALKEEARKRALKDAKLAADREHKAQIAEHERLLREQADFLKSKNTQLEKYYIMKGDIEKAWELRKKAISKDYDKLSAPQRKEMLAAREKDFKASFKKTNEEMQTSYLETIANMRETTQSVFFDFLEGKIRTSSDLFKKLGQSFASSLLNPLINGISTSLSGALFSSATSALGSIGLNSLLAPTAAGASTLASGAGSGAIAGGGIGALLSPLMDIKSLLGAGSISGAGGALMSSMLNNVGLLNASVANFSGGLALAGGGLGSFSTALGGGASALAGFGAGLAANVAGGFGIGKIMGSLGDKIFGAKTHAGQYGAIGAAIGSIVPGLGTLLGGAIGSAIGGIFGKWQSVEGGLAVASSTLLNAANKLGQNELLSYEKSEKKSWFSNKTKTEYGALADKQINMINAMFDNVHALAARLGADLDRVVIKAGQYAGDSLQQVVIPDTLLNSFLSLDVSIQDLAGQRNSIIQEAMRNNKSYAQQLNEQFAAYLNMSDQLIAEMNKGRPVQVAKYFMDTSLDSFKSLARQSGAFKGLDINSIKSITQISSVDFTKAFNESLKHDFTPQNIALWQQLGDAFNKANNSVKKVLETIINKTAELTQSMGGFMEANGMSGGIMQVGSLLSKYMALLGKLGNEIPKNLRDVLKDPFTASEKLTDMGMGAVQQLLANDKDGYKKELLNTLSSLKNIFNKQGGLAFSVPALDQIAAIDKQLKELSDPNSVAGKKDQLSVLQAQLESLKKQEGILRKLHNQAAGFRSTANKNLDYVNRAFNDTLAAAKEAFAKGDFDSKVYDELSKLASDKAGLLKEFSGSEADYKFGMLQMANALDSVGGNKTVASVQDEIVVLEGKIEDLKKQLGMKVDDNTKSTREKLEEQKQQLIIEAQKQVDAITQYLGIGSPVASYLQSVINGVANGANITNLGLNNLGNTMAGVGNNISDTVAQMSNSLQETLTAILNKMKGSGGIGGGSIGGGSTSHNNTGGSHSGGISDTQRMTLIDFLNNSTGGWANLSHWTNNTVATLQKAGYDASYTDMAKNRSIVAQLQRELATILRGGQPSSKLKNLFNIYNRDWYNGMLTPLARGGIVTGPTNALIGEAGYPEAVIPLKNGAGLKVDIGGFTNVLATKLETIINISEKILSAGASTAKNTNISMMIARDSL